MKKILLLSLVMCLAAAGCVTNPQTGQRELDPNITATVDTITVPAQQAVELATPFAASLYPPAAAILGVIGLGLAAWNKRKANNSYTLTETVVSAIEAWKAENPNDWAKLQEKLSKLIGPEAENVIRAMRGLPEKTA